MTDRARVTVCIPTYNRPDFLRRSLQSVLWQSLRDIEVIVSDNASSADVAGVIASFDDPRVVHDRLDTNIGLHGNLSRCLHLGSAPYRVVLPDDDLMLPGNLERKADFLDAHPEVGLVHSAFRHLTEDGLPTGQVINWPQLRADTVQPGLEFIGQSLAHGGIVCVSSVMLRSSLVADEEFFEADGPYCDLALWLRVALRSDVGFLPDPLSGFLLHTGSASSGYRTIRRAGSRTKLTLQHADALSLAHGRFVRRPELDPILAMELAELLRTSDRRMRLSIRVNNAVPPPLLRIAKRAVRWGPGGPTYRALSLYSAYSPQPVEGP
jgi:glycosyltransferase involved in cell wall biosynthesis